MLSVEISKKMFHNKNFADFHFLFNEDGIRKQVPAHKAILTAASDVFATMLNGDWDEENEVEIDDTSSAAFEEFLQFLYLPEVVYLANKYNVGKCKELCTQQIQDQLTTENVCSGLDFAIKLNLSELKDHCLKKISDETTKVLATEGFLECSRETLKSILTMDVSECDEIGMFNASLDWARHACETKGKDPTNIANVRDQLGDCLQVIRFGAMKPEEIAHCVGGNGELFNRDELQELYLPIGSDKSQMKIFTNTVLRERPWKQRLQYYLLVISFIIMSLREFVMNLC